MDNKALKVLHLSNGIFVLAGSLLGPLYAIYVGGITNGVMPVSVAWATFLISATLFSYILSKVGDSIKEHEYLLMAGFILRGIAWLSYIFVPDFYFLLLVQFILGIGEALGTPAFDAIFSEHVHKGHQIYEYSEWKIVSNIALVIGTLLGGYIVQNYGFQILFLLMAFLSLISFFIVYFKPRKLL